MFKIFPLTITNDGRKVPIKEAAGWKELATTDQNQIQYWQQAHGHKIKLWGIPTGPSNGLLVLDVDVKGGGLDTIKKYDVPKTMSQTTRSGGKHYVFKYPNDGRDYGNRTGFDSGLDIRGLGGYIAHYQLDDAPIADAPQWLLEQALTKTKETVNVEDAVKVAPEIAQRILDEACENIREAPQGEGNNVLNAEAYRVGKLLASDSIDREIAYNQLAQAARDRGRPEYEIKATINSGLKGGGENPDVCPFGNEAPRLEIPEIQSEESERWTPSFYTSSDLVNFQKLRKPQIFRDWSTEDIHITTADGGTGKTTLKLVEAISMALGQDFLGFKCLQQGRTLFVTGEDTKEKLGAMLGAICKQMGILKDPELMAKIKNNVLIKKDSDLILIKRDKSGFYSINEESLSKVMEAVEDLQPKMIVFDPISSFWGSESALNDMSRAVAKFMGELSTRSNACVEVINHMGKSSSKDKDMSQFAGRGGTALPSHARVSRVLRPVFDEEFEECTGYPLPEGKTAIMCNVNKFSDGSKLLNEPFIILRNGYLFERVTVIKQKIAEEQEKMTDNEKVYTFVKTERTNGRYPNKNVIVAHFMAARDKVSKDRVVRALEMLSYQGHMGEKLKIIENPDVEAGGKVYIVTDEDGREMQ